MEEEYFTCAMSARTRSISILGVVLILIPTGALGVGVFATSATRTAQDAAVVATAVSALAITILAICLGGTASFAPKGYRIGSDGITIIRRNGRSFLIAKGNLRSAEVAGPELLKGAIRTCGGSLFGAWGWFYCPALGAFRGYWADRDSLVVVRSIREQPIVLSPESRERFVKRMNELLGVSAGAMGTLGTMRTIAGRNRSGR